MKVVTFTSDFGTEDAYVAEMKGGLLKEWRSDAAPLMLDVVHTIPRHDLLRTSQIVKALLSSFPAGTVHVVVVDPGVGSSRRGLCVKSTEQFFIGPDNGIFTGILDGSEIFSMDPGVRSRLDPAATVFDGRDWFAPFAAKIAQDVPAETIGERITDPVRLELPAPILSSGEICGEVVYIDGFGNCRTNIPISALSGEVDEIRAAGTFLSFRSSYSDVSQGTALALPSSNSMLEIAVREGSASAFLGLKRGDAVAVRFTTV